MIECCRGRRLLLAGLLAIELTACQTDDRPWFGSRSAPEFTAPTPTVQDPGDIRYYPSDEPLKLGLEHFDRGNFGTAERYFRDAVEKAPRDATAWVGLAATYDRLARFDLADRAYRSAIGLTGETTQLLNNQGYSYMLRGDLENARRNGPPGVTPRAGSTLSRPNQFIAVDLVQCFWGKATGVLARRLPCISGRGWGDVGGRDRCAISLPQINHVSGSVVQTFPVEFKLINVSAGCFALAFPVEAAID